MGPLGRQRADRVLLRLRQVARRDSGYERGHSRRTRTPPAGRPASGMLWTTALSREAAYVTLLSVRGGLRRSQIMRVAR